MPTKTYPVYQLVLELESGRVDTGVRVFDIKSLNLVLAMARDGVYGRVSAKRFVLHLYRGVEDQDWPLTIRLAVPGPDGRLDHVPIALALLSQHYASHPGIPLPELRKRFASFRNDA